MPLPTADITLKIDSPFECGSKKSLLIKSGITFMTKQALCLKNVKNKYTWGNDGKSKVISMSPQFPFQGACQPREGGWGGRGVTGV